MTNVLYKLDILIQNEIKSYYMLLHNSRNRKKVIIRIHSDEAEIGHFYINKYDKSFEMDTVTAYIPHNPRNTDKNCLVMMQQ